MKYLNINGGEGNDRIDFSRIQNPTGHRYSEAGHGDDTIFGSLADTPNARDHLTGGVGNDRIISDYERGFDYSGGVGDELIDDEGDDWLVGGKEDDYLNAGSGHDYLLAGDGNDQLISDDGEADTLFCGLGTDRIETDEFDFFNGCEISD